jgi:hypothetical protein
VFTLPVTLFVPQAALTEYVKLELVGVDGKRVLPPFSWAEELPANSWGSKPSRSTLPLKVRVSKTSPDAVTFWTSANDDALSSVPKLSQDDRAQTRAAVKEKTKSFLTLRPIIKTSPFLTEHSW